MKVERVTIVFVLLLFLGSCSKEKKTAEETTGTPVIRDIQVALVRPETVEDSFESVGTVTPGKSTMLSSKTVGTIVSVLAKEGDRVKQGQTLIEIDARDLRAELEGAQAALEEVFGVRRESLQPAPWTVGVQARPVYGRWNAFYSYYWSTCYPRADERLAVTLPDGAMRLPVMELGVRPTTARAEAEVEVPNTKAAEPRAGLVFRNRCGQGQGLLLNFRLLDYLDWRKARNGPGEYVSRDPAMARSCLRLFRRLLESAGLCPRAGVRVEGDELAPGYERVYFRGEGNAYVALLRDGKAATEGALDLEAFEADRAAQVSALPRGPITLTLPGGGGHVYDVRQHAYLGRTGELTFVPHAFQPSVFQVSPYRLEAVSLSAPASAERDRPVPLEVRVAVRVGVSHLDDHETRGAVEGGSFRCRVHCLVLQFFGLVAVAGRGCGWCPVPRRASKIAE